MAQQFNLPDIGSGLQEAEIVTWHVEVGDTVTDEQVLCEVETEKSVVEIPVPFAGTILQLAGPPGTSVMVGELLVVIGEAGETVAEAATPQPSAEPAPTAADTPLAPATAPGSPKPGVMPVVRKLAKSLGVDLATVAGTGPGGRITREDVEAATPSPSEPAAPAAAPQPGQRTERRQRLSKLRRTIADHMTSRWREVPHISGLVDADASSLLATRRAVAERLGKPVPVDALLVAAVIPALKAFPATNALIDGDDIVHREYYDIGVAVGTEEGLLVPIVRDADSLGLADLVDIVTDLVTRARNRSLRPDEMGDQTFTISNLGALRGQYATQVIPAGTTGILSVGKAQEQAIVRNGSIVVAPVMGLSATFDHRAVDGLEGMGFLRNVADTLEEMSLLLV